ncbi:DUF6443 domain-containing protein [Flavobacterium sp. 3HN19-14]|uniref:DUF6443 domain-containing protein n=1 Tax=Flavobacterium sp. 3HN19-14 TaxID=3448133 RepID=UPI003EE37559
MRKLQLFFATILPVLAFAQSQNQNYIKNLIYKKPTLNGMTINQSGGGSLTASDTTVTVTYFDGLGRPIQKIAHRQAGNGKDLVLHMEYDDFGRETYQYLPYTDATATLNFITTAKIDTHSFYNQVEFENTLNPYVQKQFDESPLERTLKIASPGNDWTMSGEHTKRLEYLNNTSADNIHFYSATATWNNTDKIFDISFVDDGYYDEGELYKTVTYDENASVAAVEKEGSTIEFTNKEGKLILLRKYINQLPVDTYSVYDQFGNLAYVVPPMATDPVNQMEGYCYQYKYDNRNRLAAKKNLVRLGSL